MPRHKKNDESSGVIAFRLDQENEELLAARAAALGVSRNLLARRYLIEVLEASEERAALLAIYAEKAKRSGHAKAIQVVIAALLQSPKFLYRLEPTDAHTRTRPLDGYELATRLSFLSGVTRSKLSRPQPVPRTAKG